MKVKTQTATNANINEETKTNIRGKAKTRETIAAKMGIKFKNKVSWRKGLIGYVFMLPFLISI